MDKLSHMPRQEMGILHHAVLFGLFARNSIEIAGDSGRDVIRTAVQTYGLERGRRMAQRTRADGVEPSVMSYLTYGEWRDVDGLMVVEDAAMSPVYETGEWRDVDGRMGVEDATMSPVYETKVKRCAWNKAWKQYGLAEYGHLYCENVDASLVEGYLGKNPLQITSVLTHNDACCHFVWNGFDRTPENERAFQELKEKVGIRHIRGFDYHTAHLYFTFSGVLNAQLGTLGGQIVQRTADDFKSLFTEEVFNLVLSFHDVDFSVA